MKTRIFIILICNLIICNLQLIYSQPYSYITYDAGTSIEIQSGADVCADDIFINGTYSGTGTICIGALPVEMLWFTYSTNKNNVTLNWSTAWELNNSGFDIERKTLLSGAEVWQKIAFVQGNGTINEPKQYTFEDKKLKAGTYKFRLKQIDYNSNFEYFDLMQDVNIEPPKSFSIGQSYPNPSNPKSKIDYEIPINGKITIKLYNLLGQEVINIVNETKDAGYYTAEFDGTSLASGLYFYRIIADGSGMSFTKTLKLVLVK